MEFGNKLNTYKFTILNDNNNVKKAYVATNDMNSVLNSIEYSDRMKIANIFKTTKIVYSSTKTTIGDIVYTGINLGNNKNVALSKRNTTLTCDLIKNEYLIGMKLNKLRCDNFAIIYNHKNKEEIIMENVLTGKSLREFILLESTSDIKYIITQIFLTLRYAQRKYQFVHYNLTVDNIRITKHDGEFAYDYYGRKLVVKHKYIATIHNFSKSRMYDNGVYYFPDSITQNMKFLPNHDMHTLYDSIKSIKNLKLNVTLLQETTLLDIKGVKFNRYNAWKNYIDTYMQADNKINHYIKILKELYAVDLLELKGYTAIMYDIKNMEEVIDIMAHEVREMGDVNSNIIQLFLTNLKLLKEKVDSVSVHVRINSEQLRAKDVTNVKDVSCNYKLQFTKYATKYKHVKSLIEFNSKYNQVKEYVNDMDKMIEYYKYNGSGTLPNKNLKMWNICTAFLRQYENLFLDYIGQALRSNSVSNDGRKLIHIMEKSNVLMALCEMFSDEIRPDAKCGKTEGVKCVVKPACIIQHTIPYKESTITTIDDYVRWRYQNIDHIISLLRIKINGKELKMKISRCFKREAAKLLQYKYDDAYVEELKSILNGNMDITGDYAKRILQLLYPECTIVQKIGKISDAVSKISVDNNAPVLLVTIEQTKESINVQTLIHVPLEYRLNGRESYLKEYKGNILKYAEFNDIHFLLQ